MSGKDRSRRVWLNVALGVLVVLGAVGAYTLIGSKTQAATVSRTVRAEKGVVLSTVSATGNVKAAEELAVNFQNSGVLTSVTVQKGQKVQRGQVLATQDSASAENQVKIANANLASAQAHLQQLLDGMSPQEKQQNQVAVEQANQSLANAKTSLVTARSVAKKDNASSTLTLSQAKQQQKIDAAQLASDQKDLTAANKSVKTAQAAYDTAAAAAARDKSSLASAQAAQQSAQQKQTEDSGAAQLHQQQQSVNQTVLSNANTALQQAQSTQTAACSPDPTTSPCLSAVAATAAAQSAVDSAQAKVTAGQAQAIADQETANANAKAVSAAGYAVSQAQSALGESQTAEQTAKTSLQTAESKQESLETAVRSDQAKLRTSTSQVETAQTNLESSVARNAQSEQNAATSVVSARLAKQSTIAGNAVKEQPVSAGDLANAQAAVTTAEANLATAQTALDQTTLEAPASGTIASIGAVVGETVSGGGTTAVSSSASSSSTGAEASTPLFTLVDLNGLEVVAGFSETDAAKIRPGQPATVSIAALADEKFAAHVVAIDTLSTVTSNVVTYNVTFVLDNASAKVKPGMSADVDVVTAQVDDAINVTSSAIRTTGSRSTVTVRRNGEDTAVAVVTGLKGDSSTEIVAGIRVGTEVVLPTTTLSAGAGAGAGGFPAGGPPAGFGGGFGG